MTKPSSFASPLSSALTHALGHLDSLDTTSVAATVDLATLRQRLDLPLNESSLDPTQVIDDLVRGVEGGILGSAGGRFFGWVIGGSLPAALAADWLTSTWDQNAGLYACSPAAAVVEETAGRWLKEVLHLPSTASFAFVTGCQMAHVTCLAAARHALLGKRGWDIQQEGLAGSPAIRILTSSEKHGSTVRAVRLLGLGEKHIVNLPADDEGRLIASALQEALEAHPDAPTIVVLQAGDLNLGAYDDFNTLIPIAHRHNAWVHIDGAFGLWAAASPRLRHFLTGAEHADSWTTDGHKWLNVPYDCGYAFVADPAAHFAAMSHHAAYLTHADDARDQIDWNPEYSRRGRGFATYAALRQLGTAGVADLIDRTCAHAHTLVTSIGALPGAEIVWEPRINQGLLRFLDPSPHASDEAHDRFTDRMIHLILASGEAFFTATTWRGRRAMRVSVCNWRTSEGDVERIVSSVSKVLDHELSSKLVATGDRP
ncbi:MAG: aminotransferase class V-fold PLP-dependent enzyme [Acidobacteriota bacterium]|nr:aminotransferase class V-fold PLP-dependent enzyme [Acidobacteriota bacterium]